MSRFANLEKACGGSISIEALEEFALAMKEYKIFMAGMSEMMAPAVFKCNGLRFESREEAESYANELFVLKNIVVGIEKVKA